MQVLRVILVDFFPSFSFISSFTEPFVTNSSSLYNISLDFIDTRSFDFGDLVKLEVLDFGVGDVFKD